jgi:hypothetical protein
MIRTIHKQSMEMQRRALIAQIIPRIHQNDISNVSLNPRNRPLPIYPNRRPLKRPIRIRPHPFDSEIIRHGRSQNGRCKTHSPSDSHCVSGCELSQKKSETRQVPRPRSRIKQGDLINQIIRRRPTVRKGIAPPFFFFPSTARLFPSL